MKLMLKGAGFLATLILVFLCSCEKELEAPVFDNPLDPGYAGPQLPATPQIASCLVGDGIAVLSWTVPDTTGVGSYSLYRAAGVPISYALVASVTAAGYSDESVANGVTYYYRVCAVTRDDREGKRSDPVECTPAAFGVTIEDGRTYTTSRDVRVSFSAPSGTHAVLLANDDSFLGSSWQPYAASVVWELAGGDGQKTVWVRFRDDVGHESIALADSIVLDTRAFISSVEWSPIDSVLVPGTTITLFLDAGEPGGEAWVSIGTVIEDIELFDDGSHGDASADDGSYETVLSLPPGEEFFEELVRGEFKDEAGNSAFPFFAPRLMTVAAAPQAVVLLGATVRSGTSGPYVEVTWTQSNESDFASYRVYRDSTEVSLSSMMVSSIPDRSETFFADELIESGQEYYYKVYVLDALGLATGSNEKTVVVP